MMTIALNKQRMRLLALMALCLACVFPFSLAATGNHVQELADSDPFSAAKFGETIALSEDGKTLVVGAPRDNTFGSFAGAALVFELQNGSWVQVAKLFASDPGPSDRFGDAVAIFGNRLVVGASLDDHGIHMDAGSVYIFEKEETWSQTAQLTSTLPQTSGFFGASVRVSADRIYVGSCEDNDEGAVAIYELVPGDWVETFRLKASDAEAGDKFGISLDEDPANPNRLIVGADLGDSPSIDDTGAVYVLDFDGSQWLETAKITASDGVMDDLFGNAVALSGDTLVVGAPFDNEVELFAGSAYVFENQGGLWVEKSKLTDGRGAFGHLFGSSLCVSGSRALIGTSSGNRALVFEDQEGVWVEVQRIDSLPKSVFLGSSVAIRGSTLIVGDAGAAVNELNGAGLVYIEASAPTVSIVSTVTETTLVVSDDDGLGDISGAEFKFNGLDVTDVLLGCLGTLCPFIVQGNDLIVTIPFNFSGSLLEVTVTDQQGYQGQGNN